MKSISAALAACVCLYSPEIHAQAPDLSTTQNFFADSFGRISKCAVLVPTATQTLKSANRIGSIASYSSVYNATTDARFPKQILTKDDTKEWCTPKSAIKLPERDDYQLLGDVPFQQHKFELGGSAKIEVGKLFKALDLSWEYVDAVAVGIENIKSTDLDTGDQRSAIAVMKARGDCDETLKQSSQQMIWRICTGKVKFGVYFNRAVKGSIVNLNLGSVQAGFEVHYQNELSSVAEVPCTGTSPAVKGAEAPGGKKQDAAIPKPAVESTPGAPAAPSGAKVAEAVSAGAKEIAKAMGADPAAVKTEVAEKPAGLADESKCYNYAIYESAPDAVVGVRLSPIGSERTSVVGMAKAVKGAPKP